MMETKPFRAVKHLPILNEWLKGHNHLQVKKSDLPAIGFVALYNDKPISMAFLRRMEGGGGVFDGLASDPIAPSDIRHECNDAVIQRVIATAKQLKLKGIIGWSGDYPTIKRSLRNGFVQLPQFLVSLDLS